MYHSFNARKESEYKCRGSRWIGSKNSRQFRSDGTTELKRRCKHASPRTLIALSAARYCQRYHPIFGQVVLLRKRAETREQGS